MKVYNLPVEVPFPDPDYQNYDWDAEQRREAEHRAALSAWLRANGWTGKNTGRTVRFGVADGYALYMLAEGPGRKSCLIHLPYGDAYQYRDVEFLPKAEILRRLDQQDTIAKLFSH